MRILFYSYKKFESPYIIAANKSGYAIETTCESLNTRTAHLSRGIPVISIFAGDLASAPVLDALHEAGVKLIAVRATGYDNVDIGKANSLGIKVVNVPGYSPYAIAEHAVALLLALTRKLMPANTQVHKHNFLVDNLVGFDLHGKTVGIIGTGEIGSVFAKIMNGFGCRLLGYDIKPNPDLPRLVNIQYTDLLSLCHRSDIISIHTSLTKESTHLISYRLIKEMKPGVTIINTSRGGCVDTTDIIHFLEKGHIGAYGADVYERERDIFFHDLSNGQLKDPILKKLLSLPNVMITPHQAFATQEALTNIATATFYNIDCWAGNRPLENEVTATPAMNYVKND